MIRTAVIGVGSMGSHHAQVYRELEGAGLVTRLGALGAGVLSVAFGVIHGFHDESAGLAMDAITQPTTYLCFALVAFFAGPGMFSVDRLLFGKPASDVA